ncbi:MAG: PhzF family phenazine biosynthesis protein [Thiothrix sp.]|nr:MAG: PhzF family phenazine biosynthesis protein [Thiothrix sp.]
MPSLTLSFALADVFTNEPFTGNSLSIVLLNQELPTSLLAKITQEFRQFETIFIYPTAHATQF